MTLHFLKESKCQAFCKSYLLEAMIAPALVTSAVGVSDSAISRLAFKQSLLVVVCTKH